MAESRQPALNNPKSFEYRMSKKVSELTQVVHLLFTRNHEKEVEIEALKDAYEYEIELVQQDARGIIGRAETQLKELQLQLDATVQEAMRNDVELKMKLKEVERKLLEEKVECQKLRDLLIGSERSMEMLRDGTSNELTRIKSDLINLQKEYGRQTALLSASDSEKEKALQLCSETQRNYEECSRELEKIKLKLEKADKFCAELLERNKKLDSELRNIRSSRAKSEVNKSKANATDIEEEVERLKREVQRYRMEISNRENTYNRLFSDQRSSLVVDKQRHSIDSGSTMLVDTSDTIQARIARERATLNKTSRIDNVRGSSGTTREVLSAQSNKISSRLPRLLADNEQTSFSFTGDNKGQQLMSPNSSAPLRKLDNRPLATDSRPRFSRNRTLLSADVLS